MYRFDGFDECILVFDGKLAIAHEVFLDKQDLMKLHKFNAFSSYLTRLTETYVIEPAYMHVFLYISVHVIVYVCERA